MAEEKQTEVVKLGENMSPQEREQLAAAIAVSKQETPTGEAVDPTPETDEGEKETPKCARCGFTEGTQKPPQEDVEEYMRATLGSRRFTKTYELMKGNVRVTFTTVDTAASERMNDVICQLSALEDPVAFRGFLTKMQLIYLMSEYKVGDTHIKLETPTARTTDDVTAEFVKRFGELDESVAGMFTRTMNVFNTLKKALVEECFDENFYKGAGPF